MPKYAPPPGDVGARIKEIGGWRGDRLANVRTLLKDAAPDVTEDIKWRKPGNPGGVPVWEQNGLKRAPSSPQTPAKAGVQSLVPWVPACAGTCG